MADDQKPGDRRMAEVAACFRRADLRPAETPNTGFSLEHHYQATVAAQDLPQMDLGLSLERPLVVTTSAGD